MKKVFLTSMRVLFSIGLMLIQINPTFAKEQKALSPGFVEDPVTFELAAKITERRFKRANTNAELILMAGLKDTVEKSLLIELLKEGSYNSKPPEMKLIQEKDRTVFKFDNRISFEIVKSDRSFWINGKRLKFEKISDIFSLHDELLKIIYPKNKYSLNELFLPKAYARNDSSFGIVGHLLSLLGCSNKTGWDLGTTKFTSEFAIQCGNFFDKAHDLTGNEVVLFEKFGVENFSCKKVLVGREPNKAIKLLPKFVKVHGFIYSARRQEDPLEWEVLYKEQDGKSKDVEFSYDDEGRISKIDAKNCVHSVTKNGILNDRKPLNVKCDIPVDGMADMLSNYPRATRSLADYSNIGAEEYLNKMYGYNRLVKECEKDASGTAYSKKIGVLQKEIYESKRNADALRQKLERDVAAEKLRKDQEKEHRQSTQ